MSETDTPDRPKYILLIEDMEIRYAWLRKEFPAASITWAPSVEESGAYWDYEFDLIILDHDLGKDLQTGVDAIHILMDSHQNVDTPILIWSHNPDGSRRMMDLIDPENVWAIPFDPLSHAYKNLITDLLTTKGN